MLRLGRRALVAYNAALAAHPFKTNLATAGVATFLGDVLAQHVEHFRGVKRKSHGNGDGGDGSCNDAMGATGATCATGVEAKLAGMQVVEAVEAVNGGMGGAGGGRWAMVADKMATMELDWTRTAVMTSWGATLYAGIWLPWYKIMDKTVTFTRPVVAAAALKSGLTALIAAPVANTVFFSYVTTVEYMLESEEERAGKAALSDRVVAKLDAELLNTWASSAKLWGPVMTLNWWIVPMQYRFIVSVFVSVGWNTFLSLVQHR
ncbi:uncharacterized protein AMSG_06085 [Thecamonas trahens ATCC 50062]|uniref:Uncharacterized protein n=1 Tax=Thecamonas trahens ATCC 50062 TaxID=461836 RepID=A0A0L0DBU0_THETB|nr:hypothetical protein AMSG_06085 [Thecamonas trahens ATCC 50062]KNC49807.1 hypothetical protein AMSG_06085 [Thecamonas trahens ATCC 50062]|eukprot:XP_013757591.1 hypothetical protein AMSG_06085 [Thecamonas trahens ATCC 50062]